MLYCMLQSLQHHSNACFAMVLVMPLHCISDLSNPGYTAYIVYMVATALYYVMSDQWSAAIVVQVQRQSVRGRVLEPCNVSVTMVSTAGSGDVTLGVTKLKLNLAVDVLELVLNLQSSVLDPLVPPSPKKCAAHLSGLCKWPVP